MALAACCKAPALLLGFLLFSACLQASFAYASNVHGHPVIGGRRSLVGAVSRNLQQIHWGLSSSSASSVTRVTSTGNGHVSGYSDSTADTMSLGRGAASSASASTGVATQDLVIGTSADAASVNGGRGKTRTTAFTQSSEYQKSKASLDRLKCKVMCYSTAG
jgi:hypothetical protein